MRMAQIDENNICVVLSSPLADIPENLPANIILVGDDEEVLSRRYESGQWIEVPQEPHPTTYNTSKADIYRRCTDEEAEALHAALLSAPIRLQGIFSGATMINTGDDYYPALRAGIVAALGETRADEVLAPSNI